MNATLPPPDRSPARLGPHLDRRRFLRNMGIALALPAMESLFCSFSCRYGKVPTRQEFN